jgi:hypothetical protein
MLYISNIVLYLSNIHQTFYIMKRLYLPLFAITCTIAITGIEVFQTSSFTHSGMRTAELIFVILLALLFGLGILIAWKRGKSIKKGLPVDDELSRSLMRIAAATTFYISLVIWLVLLILNAHTELNPKFLTGIGIMVMCLVFLIVLTAKTMAITNETE